MHTSADFEREFAVVSLSRCDARSEQIGDEND